MTTYNTRNPLGSSHPKDLYDNAENFDNAINNRAKNFWTDRFGVQRQTWAGIERSGGVQGFATLADLQALAGLQIGQVAQVMNDPNLSFNGQYRWDGDNWVQASGDLAHVAINQAEAAINLASTSSTLNGDFYTSDEPEAAFSLIDENGHSLLRVDHEGYIDLRARGDFHSSDEAEPAFSLVDGNNTPILSIDEDAQLILPWMYDFFTTDEQPDYCYVDVNNVVFFGWLSTGEVVVGGGGGGETVNWEELPFSPQHQRSGQPWLNNRVVEIRRDYDDIYTVSADSFFPNSQAVHNYLDSLIDSNPDYINKSILGTDEWGNSIYQYELTNAPFTLSGWTEEDTGFPRIVIQSGVHGDERDAVLTTVLLMREICELWNQEEMLSALRWKCNLVFVPLLNPSGFDSKVRTNGNGVDLNRNTDSTTPELETLIGNSLPSLFPEAVAFIDHHNFSSAYWDGLYWLGVKKRENLSICIETCNEMIAYGLKEFDYIKTRGPWNARLTKNVTGTFAQRWQDIDNVNGFLCETPRPSSESLLDLRRFSVHGLKIFIYNNLLRELRKRSIFSL